MLKFERLERLLRLRSQLRAAALAKPRTRFLHLPPKGVRSDPARSVQESAFLMQVRLHLEAQIQTSKQLTESGKDFGHR
jgi:hypothetical protein